MQRAPLSTSGEQVGDYHPKFEGGKVVPAVVMPPQAHRELQGKQNKTKQTISTSQECLIIPAQRCAVPCTLPGHWDWKTVRFLDLTALVVLTGTGGAHRHVTQIYSAAELLVG